MINNSSFQVLYLSFIFSLLFMGIRPFGGVMFTLPNILILLLFITNIIVVFKLALKKEVLNILYPYVFLWLLLVVNTVINYFDGSISAFSVVRQSLLYVVSFLLTILYIRSYKRSENYILHCYFISLFLFYFFALFVYGFDSTGRLSVPGTNVINISFIIAIGIVFLIYYILNKKNRIFPLFVYLLLVFVSYHILVLSATRTALILSILGPIMLLYFHDTKYRTYIIIIGSLIFFLIGYILYSIPAINERFITIEDEINRQSYFGNRFPIWLIAIEFWKENIIFGGGASGWEYYSRFISTDNHARISIHSQYVELLATSGIVGVSLFMIFYYKLYRSSLFLFVKEKKIIYIVVMVVIFVYGFVQEPYTNYVTWIIFGIIVGKSLIYAESKNNKYTDKKNK